MNCTELARNQLRLLSESRRTTMKMITTMNEQLQRRTAATTKLPSAEHTVESQQNVEVDVYRGEWSPRIVPRTGFDAWGRTF